MREMDRVMGVLLGVAEVKLPLRRLPQDMRMRIANASHFAVVHDDTVKGSEEQEPPDEAQQTLREDRQRFIGVVDSYYALQEVSVEVEGEECKVKRNEDIVLQHKPKDVIIATVVPNQMHRIVYITRNDSFGRAAVVMQMMNPKDVEKLMCLFPENARTCNSLRVSSNGVLSGSGSISPRDSKASWSRGMGKKFASILNTLATNSGSKKASQRSEKSPEVVVVPTNEDVSYAEADSESSSDEDEVISEDGDSKSESMFYEDHGLDKAVQERLYDNDSVDSVSQSSDSSSTDSNAAVIEAEIKFFVETDKNFLEALQSLEEDRKELSSEETPQYIRGKLTLLFAQIEYLVLLHQELHDEFEKSDTSPLLLSEAIVRHREQYEKYVYFMENIPTVDGILSTYADYFKEEMPLLPEKLRKPRMRLHYYVLTLETLLKRVSTKAEKRAIQEAMDVLKVPLKKADSKLFLGAVTGSPLDLSNFGNLIRHSDLQLRRGGDLPKRMYHVLLLKTIIIITLSQGRNYKYITSFRIDQVSLRRHQERGVFFTLDVRNGPRGQAVSHVFKAKNINMQQLWINDLKAIIKVKSQNSTPRHSFVEGDSELRISNRRSKLRRGLSSEISQSSNSNPELTKEDENDQARNPSEYGRPRRRGALKKHSSASSRNRPVVRQQSGYSSDGEYSVQNWKSNTFSTPLTVWTVFRHVEDLYKLSEDNKTNTESLFAPLSSILDHEIKYIDWLNIQLGSILNDEEGSRPPPCIVTHLRKLFDFHGHTFLKQLEQATSLGSAGAIARCFRENEDSIREIYSSFLADRVRLDKSIEEMKLKNAYVNPVFQMQAYVKSLLNLRDGQDPDGVLQINDALSVMQAAIADANTILLTESVDGSPFDLDECGTMLMEGRVKVRFPGQLMKQEMHAVLLDTMILLLENRQPRYQYVEALMMDTVGLGPMPDANSFTVEVRIGAARTASYLFKTPRRDEKETWVEKITDILKQQVEKLKQKQQRRLGQARNLKDIEGNDITDLHSIAPRQKPSPSPSPLETSL